MAIENVWPGNKAKGLLRAMYNIAVRRLNPGHPPERDQDVMQATVDGHREWVRLYGSAAPSTHWIRFAQSVAETLRAATKIHPGEPVIFLALWRNPKADDRIIHTWRIPAAVVDQIDAQLPAGIEEKNRNLIIRRYKNDGRWYWTGSGVQRIDLTNYYAPWNLDDDEMAYLRDLPSPPEPKNDGTPESDGEEENDAETVPTIERLVGANKIYFGPPGTGKTWRADAYCRARHKPVILKTTFHPEYSTTTFAGRDFCDFAICGSTVDRQAESIGLARCIARSLRRHSAP